MFGNTTCMEHRKKGTGASRCVPKKTLETWPGLFSNEVWTDSRAGDELWSEDRGRACSLKSFMDGLGVTRFLGRLTSLAKNLHVSLRWRQFWGTVPIVYHAHHHWPPLTASWGGPEKDFCVDNMQRSFAAAVSHPVLEHQTAVVRWCQVDVNGVMSQVPPIWRYHHVWGKSKDDLAGELPKLAHAIYGESHILVVCLAAVYWG